MQAVQIYFRKFEHFANCIYTSVSIQSKTVKAIKQTEVQGYDKESIEREIHGMEQRNFST